jgi:hypothetical protein
LAISSGAPSLPRGTLFEIIFKRRWPVSEEASSSLSPGILVEPGSLRPRECGDPSSLFSMSWYFRAQVAQPRRVTSSRINVLSA